MNELTILDEITDEVISGSDKNQISESESEFDFLNSLKDFISGRLSKVRNYFSGSSQPVTPTKASSSVPINLKPQNVNKNATSESATLQNAIRSGINTENTLTDILFYNRYPALRNVGVLKSNPAYSQLSAEWVNIRNTIVRPAIGSSVMFEPKDPYAAIEDSSIHSSPSNVFQFNQYHAQKVLNAMNNGILGTYFVSKTQMENVVRGEIVKKVNPRNQTILILPLISHLAEQATINNYRDIIIGSFIRDPKSNGLCSGHCKGSCIDINYKGGFTTSSSVQMVIRILQWLLLIPAQNRRNLGFGMPLQGAFFGNQRLVKFDSVSPHLLGDPMLRKLVPQLGIVFPDNDNHLHIQLK